MSSFPILIRINSTSPNLIHPSGGKLLHVPTFAQRQRLERDHVVLILWCIACGGRMCGRVYHAQRWSCGGGGGGEESGEFFVSE